PQKGISIWESSPLLCMTGLHDRLCGNMLARIARPDDRFMTATHARGRSRTKSARRYRLLQRLQQSAVDRLVAGDDVAGAEHVLAARLVGGEAAGLAHQKDAGTGVPGRHALLPEAVHASRRHIGKVE